MLFKKTQEQKVSNLFLNIYFFSCLTWIAYAGFAENSNAGGENEAQESPIFNWVELPTALKSRIFNQTGLEPQSYFYFPGNKESKAIVPNVPIECVLKTKQNFHRRMKYGFIPSSLPKDVGVL